MTKTTITEESALQADFFNSLGEEYVNSFGNNVVQNNSVYWLKSKLEKGAKVLDLGCGTGEMLKYMANEGYIVTGIDSSYKMLEYAAVNAPNAELLLMDMVSLDLDNREFDAITAYFSLLMLRKDQIKNVIKQIYRLLKPGGYFILSMVEGDFDFIEIPFLGQKVRVSAYTQADLEGLIRNSSLNLITTEINEFIPGPGANPERQLFLFCQK